MDANTAHSGGEDRAAFSLMSSSSIRAVRSSSLLPSLSWGEGDLRGFDSAESSRIDAKWLLASAVQKNDYCDGKRCMLGLTARAVCKGKLRGLFVRVNCEGC